MKECKTNKISGIYLITNKVNGKVYVGSSIDINRRITEHKRRLKNNKHSNEYLQRSFNKHGKEAFTFELLEEHDVETLIPMEQYWINMTNCANEKHGYNLSPTAGNNIGSKRTDVHKKKISLGNSKKVYQFDLNGVLLNEYFSLTEAERKSGVSNSMISLTISGKHKTAGGFLWSFTKEVKLPKYKSYLRLKPVNCFNMEGNFIKQYPSVSVAAKETGIDHKGIKNVCEGATSQSGGYLWSFTEISPKYRPPKHFTRPVICLNLNDNFIAKYESARKANQATKIAASDITRVCKGKSKTAGGFIWKYAS